MRDLDILASEYAKGEYASVESRARHLLVRSPQDLALHEWLANALLAQSRNEEAREIFARAAAMAPLRADLVIGQAKALFSSGQYKAALACCQSALRLQPKNWTAILIAADALAALGLSEKALLKYQEALEIENSDSDIHLGLGILLQKMGHLEKSLAAFRAAIDCDPGCPAGYCNYANTLTDLGRIEEAIAFYGTALRIAPQAAAVHCSLGAAFQSMERYDEALASFKHCLDLDPGLSRARCNAADVLRRLGHFAEAASHYHLLTTPEGTAKKLECLHLAGLAKDYDAWLDVLSSTQPGNIRAAAISSFVAALRDEESPFPFCRDPLKFVAIQNILDACEPFHDFRAALLGEVAAYDSVWNPPGKSTQNGFQTSGNIFALKTPAMMRLRKIVEDRIQAYFSEREGISDYYIRGWDSKRQLSGWLVRLRSQGRQTAHIHPDGWLSGVFYLGLPQDCSDNEGAIRFSLAGYDYPPAPQGMANLLHLPRSGDLALFPSSLFHETVPFVSDQERISIAFDLIAASG